MFINSSSHEAFFPSSLTRHFVNCLSQPGHRIHPGHRKCTINATTHKNPKVLEPSGTPRKVRGGTEMECCNGNYLALMMSQDAAKCFPVFTAVASWRRVGVAEEPVKGQRFDCPAEDNTEKDARRC